jgi:hypothetical protein
MNAQAAGGGGVSRVSPGGGTLADVLDRVLDKGIVIDAWAAVSLLGIEILSVQAQVIVASVETYLKYAEAVSSVSLPAEKPAKEMPAEVHAPGAHAPKALAEHVPSEDELIKYLGEHAGGLRIDDMVEHFNAPKQELEQAVGHLVDERRVRKDPARNVFLPASPKG